MAGTVINDKFQAQFGFESPKYTVDTAGKITAETLDVKSILLNGKIPICTGAISKLKRNNVLVVSFTSSSS